MCDLVVDVVSALLGLSRLFLSGKHDFFLCFGWVMSTIIFYQKMLLSYPFPGEV